MGDTKTEDLVKNLISKVTGLANDISGSLIDRIICAPGTDCYNEKRDNALQNKWDREQTKYNNAPEDLSRAEKNYYVFNKGENGGETNYNNIIIDRFATTAKELRANSVEKQQDYMNNLSHMLKQYIGEKQFVLRSEELLKVREKERRELNKKINKYEGILQTSERKVIYEHKDMDSLYTYRRVMLFLYYSVIVCYIIFGNFIPDKLYKNYSIWGVIVIAVIFPIILNILTKWIFILYDAFSYWLAEIPHKDVYADL